MVVAVMLDGPQKGVELQIRRCEQTICFAAEMEQTPASFMATEVDVDALSLVMKIDTYMYVGRSRRVADAVYYEYQGRR